MGNSKKVGYICHCSCSLCRSGDPTEHCGFGPACKPIPDSAYFFELLIFAPQNPHSPVNWTIHHYTKKGGRESKKII